MKFKKPILNEDEKFRSDDLADLGIDFDEFDSVIAKTTTIVATDNNDDDIEDLSISTDEIVDVDDFSEDVEDEEEFVDECGDTEVELHDSMKSYTKKIKESGKKASKGSLLDIYESKMRRKNNPLVESLLCGKAVEDICVTLDNQLKSHGISKAQSIATIGMILDRLLKATDDDITSPVFVDQVIGELVDTDDLKGIIKSAIDQAITGDSDDIKPVEDMVDEPEELKTEVKVDVEE